MAKYIGYDETSNRVKKLRSKDRKNNIKRYWLTNDILELLECASKNKNISIDIIKCKDCKYFSSHPDHCHRLASDDVDEDFWCKYGEK